MLSLLSLLLACGPGSDSLDSAQGGGFGLDTGASYQEPTLSIEAEASLSPVIPSVVRVSWESDRPEVGEVEYGDRLEHRATAELGEDGRWQAVLVGFPEEHEAHFRVRHGDEVAEPQVIRTGAGPDWLPNAPDITGTGAPGFLLTGFRGDDGVGALILDTEGRPVWWYSLEEFGEEAYTSRVSLDPAREAVWFSIIKLRSAGADADAQVGIVRVSLDGTEVQHRPLEKHHHDFWLHEDGRVVFLSTEIEGEGEDAWSYDDLKVMETDGTQRQLWSTSAFMSPGDSSAWLNTVEYVEETDSYWVGAKNRKEIYQIDAVTGQTLETIGSKPGATMMADDAFSEQHGFDILGDELLVFDNGDPGRSSSRGARYKLDADAGTATLTWQFYADPALYTPMLGDALQLPDGNILLNWTSQSHVAQVTPEGEVVSSWTYDDLEMLTFARFEEAVVP